MPSLRLRLSVFVGGTVPLPLPPPLLGRLRSAKVTMTDGERSAFTLEFDAGRTRASGALDPPGFGSALRPFTRVALTVTMGAVPSPLIDGIVTDVRLVPGTGPGDATQLVTGEDVSYLLDQVERDEELPGLSDQMQVYTILTPYASQRITPAVTPPAVFQPAAVSDRIPSQHGTDLAHLTDLARRNGYVAYIKPGLPPGPSIFYWGPPIRAGLPQAALTVDSGPATNVTQISFRTDALAPTLISGAVTDRTTGQVVQITTPGSTRLPLSAQPLLLVNRGDVKERRLRDAGSEAVGAFVRALAQVDQSIDAVIAEGSVDGLRYGAPLRPGGLVGVRGAGLSHDGLWYVRRVEHNLSAGTYTQAFTLARDGFGTTVPILPAVGVG